MFSLTMQQAD